MARANSRLHTPTARTNMEHECPNPDLEPKLEQDTSAGIRSSIMKQSTKTRDRVLTRKQDKRGESGLCHKTTYKLDRWDRTLTGTFVTINIFYFVTKIICI